VIVTGVYSFKRGQEVVEADYAAEHAEILEIIGSVEAAVCRTKTSQEKTMDGRLLYSPKDLNRAFDAEFEGRQWAKSRIYCDYSTDFYMSGFTPSTSFGGAFREMDFVKNKVGVEVQFGKYAFMVYNVCAKMTIFHNEGVIGVGVEIVPVKDLAAQMSSGVSYFEQIVWDLEHRGTADIDIPVLILGVASGE
jgi:hypothetical protein